MTKGFFALSKVNRIWVLAVVLLVSFGISGCSAVKAITEGDKESKLLFKSRDQYVRIVKQDAAKGVKVPPNEQPVALDSDQIRLALSTLEIMLPKQDKSLPVFTKAELDTLARYLSQGLAAAGSDEDVIFAVIDDYRALLGLAKEPKYTSGRVFYREGKLNIIFGKIMEDYKGYGLYAPEDRRLKPLAPGSRFVPSEHVWTLLDQPDQTFYATNEGARTDWVVLDLASMEARMILGEKAAAQAGTGGSGSGQVQPKFKTEKTVEERLSILNDLKSKKLITEEEYQKKRSEILKDL
jgi:hypothetical protein